MPQVEKSVYMDATTAEEHEQAAEDQGVSFSEYVRQHLPDLSQSPEASA